MCIHFIWVMYIGCWTLAPRQLRFCVEKSKFPFSRWEMLPRVARCFFPQRAELEKLHFAARFNLPYSFTKYLLGGGGGWLGMILQKASLKVGELQRYLQCNAFLSATEGVASCVNDLQKAPSKKKSQKPCSLHTHWNILWKRGEQSLQLHSKFNFFPFSCRFPAVPPQRVLYRANYRF